MTALAISFSTIDPCPGGRLNIKMSFYHLIFNMGIPIPGKDGLYIETRPKSPINYRKGLSVFQVMFLFHHVWEWPGSGRHDDGCSGGVHWWHPVSAAWWLELRRGQHHREWYEGWPCWHLHGDNTNSHGCHTDEPCSRPDCHGDRCLTGKQKP